MVKVGFGKVNEVFMHYFEYGFGWNDDFKVKYRLATPYDWGTVEFYADTDDCNFPSDCTEKGLAYQITKFVNKGKPIIIYNLCDKQDYEIAEVYKSSKDDTLWLMPYDFAEIEE